MKNSRGGSAPRKILIHPVDYILFRNLISFAFARCRARGARFCDLRRACASIALIFPRWLRRKSSSRDRKSTSLRGEITAAAQDVTSRKPDITIRPDFRPVAGAPKGEGPADSISISLDDASHMGALRQAFREIARRHELSLAEASTSSGVVRFDFTFNGVAHAHRLRGDAGCGAIARDRAVVR